MTSVHDRRPCGKHTLLVRFNCQHNTSQCHLREKLPLRSSLDQTGLWSCLRDIVWIAKWCRKVQPIVSSTIFRGLFWAVQKIQLSISQWVIELGSTAFFHGFWLKCLPLAPSKTDHKLEIVRQITLSSPKSILVRAFCYSNRKETRMHTDFETHPFSSHKKLWARVTWTVIKLKVTEKLTIL